MASGDAGGDIAKLVAPEDSSGSPVGQLNIRERSEELQEAISNVFLESGSVICCSSLLEPITPVVLDFVVASDSKIVVDFDCSRVLDSFLIDFEKVDILLGLGSTISRFWRWLVSSLRALRPQNKFRDEENLRIQL